MKKGLIIVALVAIVATMVMVSAVAAKATDPPYCRGFDHGYYAGVNGHQPANNISYSQEYREGYHCGYLRGQQDRFFGRHGHGHSGHTGITIIIPFPLPPPPWR